MHDPLQAFRTAILAALGHAPEEIEPGKFQRFGTSDRRGDSAGWCKLFDDMRGGVFGCYRAGLSETWSAADRATMTRGQRAELARQVMTATAEREAQQRQQWAENARRIAQVWAQCVPLVAGDPVTLYLKRRGFGGVWPLPELLRFHRALPYWHGAEKLGTFAAMVAPIITPNGRTVALHRTYLATDGRKADVPSPKKLTGAAGPLAGACIPLHKPARGCIGIAEGIETALAAWCASSVPTVASYCAGNLAAWQWPAGVQRLVIFADADKAGREAADTLRALALAEYFESHARRLHSSGRRMTVKAARTIIDKARAGTLPDPFTARDVYRNQWAGLSDRAAVADALDMLAAHEWLTETTIETGGRPTATYSLTEGARRGYVGRATG